MDETESTNSTPKKRSGVDWAPSFLRSLAKCGVIGYAAKAAGIHRTTVYLRRDSDDAFAKQMRHALSESTDRLLQEAVRRARIGVKEPVFQYGRHVGDIRRYSDTLLIFLLKGLDPATWRETFVHNLTSPDGKPVQVKHEHEITVMPEAIESFLAGLEARGGTPGDHDISRNGHAKSVHSEN